MARAPGSTPGAGRRGSLLVKTGDTTLVPLVTTSAVELSPAVSPDGRWLAYSSAESGTAEVYVRPFPDAATARWQFSASGGTNPVCATAASCVVVQNWFEELKQRAK
jgi:Tol biopolymer transport system component